jgi:hypothetical protein
MLHQESVYADSVGDSDAGGGDAVVEQRTRFVLAHVLSYFRGPGGPGVGTGSERVAKFVAGEDLGGSVAAFVGAPPGAPPRYLLVFDRRGRLGYTHKPSELPARSASDGPVRALAFVKAGGGAWGGAPGGAPPDAVTGGGPFATGTTGGGVSGSAAGGLAQRGGAPPASGGGVAGSLGSMALGGQERLLVLPLASGSPLRQLEATLRCIFLPLITRARAQWPDIVVKEVCGTLQGLLASTQVVVGLCEGNTRLPRPGDDVLPARLLSGGVSPGPAPAHLRVPLRPFAMCARVRDRAPRHAAARSGTRGVEVGQPPPPLRKRGWSCPPAFTRCRRVASL